MGENQTASPKSVARVFRRNGDFAVNPNSNVTTAPTPENLLSLALIPKTVKGDHPHLSK